MTRILVLFLALAACGLAQSVNNLFPALTATGAPSVAFSVATVAPRAHTIQVSVTGSPAVCTLRLEGSLDNVAFFDLSGAQSCTAAMMFHIAERPVLFVRPYIVTLSGGSSPSVRVRYLGVR